MARAVALLRKSKPSANALDLLVKAPELVDSLRSKMRELQQEKYALLAEIGNLRMASRAAACCGNPP